MQLLDIQLYRELGIEVASLVIVIGFAKYITTKSFAQIERTSIQLEENNQKFLKFAEEQHKQTQEILQRHSETLIRLNDTLESHVKIQNDALALIKEKDKTINELFSMLKSCLRTN